MKIISGTLDREKRTLNARLTNVNLLERARLAPGRAGAVLSLYGGMPLLRIKCPVCKKMAIVQDGITLCCEARTFKPKTYSKKRICDSAQPRKHLTPNQKDIILGTQGYRCFYCNERLDGVTIKGMKLIALKIHFDHFVPWKFSGDGRTINIVAACHICNQIKHDLLFETIEEARVYINHRRGELGYGYHEDKTE